MGCSEMKADENTQSELWRQARWSKHCIPGTGWLKENFVIKIVFLRQIVLLRQTISLVCVFGAGGEILLIFNLNPHPYATASPLHRDFLIFGFISMSGSISA